jgi:hypothetical protein
MDSETNLIQLFHSLPIEIREKIQRFTYKIQNSQLLQEIAEFALAKQYLNEFTILVDTANSMNGFNETTDNIRDRLWNGLNLIRNVSYKNLLVKEWKYEKVLQCTERDHKNGEKNFRLLDWETSYVVNFWMCIYH